MHFELQTCDVLNFPIKVFPKCILAMKRGSVQLKLNVK